MAVTANALPQKVELAEPGHIVISDNSSPRPFIWQSSIDLTFFKISRLSQKLLTAALQTILAIHSLEIFHSVGILMVPVKSFYNNSSLKKQIRTIGVA